MRELKEKSGFGQRNKMVSFAELSEMDDGEVTEILFAEIIISDDDDYNEPSQTAHEEEVRIDE